MQVRAQLEGLRDVLPANTLLAVLGTGAFTPLAAAAAPQVSSVLVVSGKV